MTTKATAADIAAAQQHVKVTVNRKPVVIAGPRSTGLAIKEAAIAQGVEIKLDFVLSVKLPNGEMRIIGDRDPVHVRDGMEFVAVAPDDNS